MLDAVLFDFDGVIRQWDEPELATFEADAGYEIGTVFEVAFDRELNHPVISGQATWQQWRDETTRRLIDAHGTEIVPVVDRFFAFEGRIDQGMVDLLEALRSQVRVGLLTNNHDRFEAYLERMGLHGHFDVIANTHRLGVAKPHSDAYIKALDQLDVAPARCLFTDDLEHNIDGALAVGLHAHHFVEASGFIEHLAEWGLRTIGPPDAHNEPASGS